MENQNRNKVIDELIQTNFEYKRLHKEHQDIETKILALDKQKYLSLEEEKLRKELQKKKLNGRDHMERLISEKASPRL